MVIEVKMLVILWESFDWEPAGILEIFYNMIWVVIKHTYVCVLKHFFPIHYMYL